MSFLWAFVYSLLMNVLPLVEVIHRGSPPAVLLCMYWCETAVLVVVGALRIVLHRRATGMAGHYADSQQVADPKVGAAALRKRLGSPNTYLRGQLTINLLFTVTHGFFIALLVFLFGLAGPVDGEDLKLAATWVLTLHLVFLLWDLPTLGRWSFFRLQQVTGQAALRGLVTQLGLIFGLIVSTLSHSPWGLVGTFIVLRAVVDALMAWFSGLGRHRDLPPGLARRLSRRSGQTIGDLEAEFDKVKALGAEVDAVLERPIAEVRPDLARRYGG